MNILFLHRDFPGQFKHIAAELAKDSKNRVVFITENLNNIEIPDVEKLAYTMTQRVPDDCHPYMKNYLEAVMHGQAALSLAINLKQRGFEPDIVYGFSGWGNSMFMKDAFPNVPFLSYYEWYYNSDSEDISYSGIKLAETDKESIRCKNAKLLIDLYSSDAGLSPTEWQKSHFPKEFQPKIKVIHDGIDSEFFKPDPDAKFLIKDKNLELTAKDEVVTYVTRGMEAYRGFPQAMEAIEKVLKKRPNAHVIIAGDDVICYGPKLEYGTYKQHMLQQLKLDMNRVHFVGHIPYEEYVKLLQISSVHLYLTVPYILSWSILEAMSTGCCVVASSTQPVLEVMKNNYNGLLADFFSVEHIVKRMLFALENKKEAENIRKNARQTILEKYELKDMLRQQIDYMNSLM